LVYRNNLHDRNCRIITTIWRPFQILFSRLRRNWNIKTSVIDTFVTFFFLSNIKFLSVSFDLLVPTKIYQLHLEHYNSSHALYYAPDIQYLGRGKGQALHKGQSGWSQHVLYLEVPLYILFQCLFHKYWMLLPYGIMDSTSMQNLYNDDELFTSVSTQLL